jgi:nucleoside-diphosphate-sugar epimerase
MAKLVAEKIAGGTISVVFDIPEGNVFGYAADTHLALESGKLRSLGWAPHTDLEEMYRRMIRYLRETA